MFITIVHFSSADGHNCRLDIIDIGGLFQICCVFNSLDWNKREISISCTCVQSLLHLMLSSHLPRAPCNKFVYDFLCDFFGHRRWQRATAYVFTLSTSIVRFLVRALGGGGGGQAGVNPYRGCAEIVRKSCNLSGVAVQSPQPPDGNRTETVRLPCRGCAVTVAQPRRFWACGLRAVPVWGLCNATYDNVYGLWTDDFSNLYNFPLNKIIEGTEPVNPYENLTAASCLCTEASQRPHGKGDTGRIRAP